MKRIALLISVLTISALAFAQEPPPDQSGFVPIHGKIRRERVAVPAFRGDGHAAQLLTQSLREGFAMIGLFELVDPASYPDLSLPGAANDFSVFKVLGADYVVTGEAVRLDASRYQVEIRCQSLRQDKMVLGKRYSGGSDLLNRMALKYLDEFLNWLTGRAGGLDARIAYISTPAGTRGSTVRVMDTDGRHDSQLTTARSLYLSPAWSPDGRFLAYTGYRARNPDIYLADISQGKEVKFFASEGTNASPQFSPDGRSMAFSREENGNMDLFVITVPGKEVRRLTSSRGDEISPAWSPDGHYLAFVSNRGGSPHVYMIDLTRGAEGPGNPAVRLTEGSRAEYPAWSPDGRFIAYSGMVGGQYDIFLIDMGGSRGARRLTATPANEERPTWSADSRFLAYASNPGGNYDIYITSIYGGTPRRITTSAANDRMPAWSPKQK